MTDQDSESEPSAGGPLLVTDAGRRSAEVRQRGASGAVVLAIMNGADAVRSSVSLRAASPLDPASADGLQLIVVLIGVVGAIICLWLAAVIWRKAALWACGVVASLAALDVAFYLVGWLADMSDKVSMMFLWASLAPLLVVGDALLIGLGVMKAQGASGSPLQGETPGATARRKSRPMRHAMRFAAGLVILATIGAGLYFYTKAMAPQPQAVAPQVAAPVIAAQPAAVPEAGIPSAELEGLYDPPNPATISAVATRVRELCNTRGTEDHVLMFDERAEMAGGEVAGFDALAKRGFKRNANDQQCYQDAKATLQEAVEDQKLREEAAAEPAQKQ